MLFAMCDKDASGFGTAPSHRVLKLSSRPGVFLGCLGFGFKVYFVVVVQSSDEELGNPPVSLDAPEALGGIDCRRTGPAQGHLSIAPGVYARAELAHAANQVFDQVGAHQTAHQGGR